MPRHAIVHKNVMVLANSGLLPLDVTPVEDIKQGHSANVWRLALVERSGTVLVLGVAKQHVPQVAGFTLFLCILAVEILLTTTLSDPTTPRHRTTTSTPGKHFANWSWCDAAGLR